METKWLEDFVSLAETRSFSRSAQLRHVTQPAFSRRSYPTHLTPAGETLYAQALELLQSLHNTRDSVRLQGLAEQDLMALLDPSSQKS
jgi:LysR family transcriptional regulator, hypochlorite-specific transcription factor HypT